MCTASPSTLVLPGQVPSATAALLVLVLIESSRYAGRAVRRARVDVEGRRRRSCPIRSYARSSLPSMATADAAPYVLARPHGRGIGAKGLAWR